MDWLDAVSDDHVQLQQPAVRFGWRDVRLTALVMDDTLFMIYLSECVLYNARIVVFKHHNHHVTSRLEIQETLGAPSPKTREKDPVILISHTYTETHKPASMEESAYRCCGFGDILEQGFEQTKMEGRLGDSQLVFLASVCLRVVPTSDNIMHNTTRVIRRI